MRKKVSRFTSFSKIIVTKYKAVLMEENFFQKWLDLPGDRKQDICGEVNPPFVLFWDQRPYAQPSNLFSQILLHWRLHLVTN